MTTNRTTNRTTYRQLPGAGEIFLDHSGHFVPDMEAASAALGRMGFTMTPYTMHTMTTAPGEEPRPSGTANRCIMLREGYLEILCAVGDAPLAQQLNAAVARYAGLHLLAFSCASAPTEHARLTNAGFAMQPLVNLTRTVDDGTLRFSVVRLDPGQMPEGRTQFLQHDTPDLLWREDLMNHPNGIVAVADVYDALRSNRAYRCALSREEAIALVEESADSHFDPACVTAFLRVVNSWEIRHAADSDAYSERRAA